MNIEHDTGPAWYGGKRRFAVHAFLTKDKDAWVLCIDTPWRWHDLWVYFK